MHWFPKYSEASLIILGFLIAAEFINIPVIASGGVGTLDHFYEGVIEGRADALLAASVFHFNEISIKEVKKYLKNKNINIRD